MTLRRLLRRRGADFTDAPFRDEFLRAQRLEPRALALAARFTIDAHGRATNILPRFADNARVLRSAYQTLAEDVRAGRFISAASVVIDHLAIPPADDARDHDVRVAIGAVSPRSDFDPE